MTDKITKRLETRHAQLQALQDSEERWFRKLRRAVFAIEKIRDERKRLLKPRKLEPGELKVDSKEWTKIRDTDFGDTLSNI